MAQVITHNNNEEDMIEIDLGRLLIELFRYIKRFWWLIIVLMALGVSLVFIGYSFVKTPMYQATSTFTVTAGDEGDSYNYSESTADQLSKTFPYVLRSDYFQNVLLDKMGRKYINGTLTATTLENSNMVTMTMTSNNPQDAYAFLNAAIDVYPETAHFVLGNISFYMIEKPTIPTNPYNQLSIKRKLAYGLGGGFLVSLFILIVMIFLNQNVISPEDLKHDTNLKCLAYNPQLKGTIHGKGIQKNLLVDELRMSQAYRESMSTLAMRVQRDMKKTDSKLLMITSTIDNEGKTLTAVNLCISLAQKEKKVLLIDTDFRNNTENTVANLLSIKYDSERNIYKETGHKNLSVLISRNINNPSGILSSKEYQDVILEMSKYYDYIVFDTPACTLYQDSLILTDLVDEILYVIKYDAVSLNDIRKGIHLLEGGSARLLGYTFNFSPETMGDYGYGRYGYYGNNYGYSSYGGYSQYGYGRRKSVKE